MYEMIKIRPAASSSLDDAMARVTEVKNFDQLLVYLQENYYFWCPTAQNVRTKHYMFDDRIGWNTWMVTVDGHAAVFADGEIKKL
jgi:hypothetical protein